METSNNEIESLDDLIELSINFLINKRYEHLSPDEIRIIIRMLCQLDYFKKLEDQLGLNGIRKISKCITIKHFPINAEVIKYGDEGKTFYIILKGEVSILIPNFHKKGETEFIKIGNITRGNSFGDLSLIRKKPRSATITCLTDCVLAEINYEDYSNLLNQIDSEKLNNFISFMRSFEMFKNFPRSYVERFYFISEIKKIKKGEVVYREGDAIDGIYFITQGEFSVTRSAQYTRNKLKEVETELEYLKKEQNMLLQSLYGNYNKNSSYIKNLEMSLSPKTKRIHERIDCMKPPNLLELVILKDHDIFGDLEIFKVNQGRLTSVTCKLNSHVYFFQKDKFMKTLTPFLLQSFEKLADLKSQLLTSRYKNGIDYYIDSPRRDQPNKNKFLIRNHLPLPQVKIPYNEKTPTKMLATEVSCKSNRRIQMTENVTYKNSIFNTVNNLADSFANSSRQKIIKKSFLIEDKVNKSMKLKARLNVTTCITEEKRRKTEKLVSPEKLKQLNQTLKNFHKDKIKTKLHGMFQKTLNSVKITNNLSIFKKHGALLKAKGANTNTTATDNTINNSSTTGNLSHNLQETNYKLFTKNFIKKPKRFFAPLVLKNSGFNNS